MKIEKGIPIPKKKGSGNQYPWDKMKIGDSLFFPISPKANQHSKKCSILSAARIYCNTNNLDWKFTSRTVDGGFRIWRIK